MPRAEGVVKKPPQRRLNIIDGFINGYFVHLNSPARMDLIRQTNDLSAVLADMQNDRQMGRDTSKKRSVDKETSRIQKAKMNKEKAEEKRRV